MFYQALQMYVINHMVHLCGIIVIEILVCQFKFKFLQKFLDGLDIIIILLDFLIINII